MESNFFQYRGESIKEVIASNFLGNIIMAHISWNFSSPNFSANSFSHSFQFKIKLVSKVDYFSSQTCLWLEFFSFKCSKTSWRVSCASILFWEIVCMFRADLVLRDSELTCRIFHHEFAEKSGVPNRMKIRVNMKKVSFWNKAWVPLVCWTSVTLAKLWKLCPGKCVQSFTCLHRVDRRWVDSAFVERFGRGPDIGKIGRKFKNVTFWN